MAAVGAVRIGKALAIPILLTACGQSPEAFRLDLNLGAYEGEKETSWWSARPEIVFQVTQNGSAHVQVQPSPRGESLVAEMWRFEGKHGISTPTSRVTSSRDCWTKVNTLSRPTPLSVSFRRM